MRDKSRHNYFSDNTRNIAEPAFIMPICSMEQFIAFSCTRHTHPARLDLRAPPANPVGHDDTEETP